MTERVWLVENVGGRERLVGSVPPDPITLEIIRVPEGSLKEWPGRRLSAGEEIYSYFGTVLFILVCMICLPACAVVCFGNQLLADFSNLIIGVSIFITYVAVVVTVMQHWVKYIHRRHNQKITDFCSKYGITHDHTTIGIFDESSKLKHVLLEEGKGL